MSIISRIRKQTAVLWDNPTPDGAGGWTFDSPTEIECRWETVRETYFRADGTEATSDATVYVPQYIQEGAYLYLGELTDFDSSDDTDNPETLENAYRVQRYEALPNIRNTETLHMVRL